jgi:hypothetical protein
MTVLYVPGAKVKDVFRLEPATLYARTYGAVYIPTDETPFAQLVVAVAAKCTGEVMAVPVEGVDTVTVAKHGSAENKTQQKKIFIFLNSGNQFFICETDE